MPELIFLVLIYLQIQNQKYAVIGTIGWKRPFANYI